MCTSGLGGLVRVDCCLRTRWPNSCCMAEVLALGPLPGTYDRCTYISQYLPTQVWTLGTAYRVPIRSYVPGPRPLQRIPPALVTAFRHRSRQHEYMAENSATAAPANGNGVSNEPVNREKEMAEYEKEKQQVKELLQRRNQLTRNIVCASSSRRSQVPRLTASRPA